MKQNLAAETNLNFNDLQVNVFNWFQFCKSVVDMDDNTKLRKDDSVDSEDLDRGHFCHNSNNLSKEILHMNKEGESGGDR